MKIDSYVIAFIVFSVFIVTMVLVIGDVNNNYDDVNMSTDDFGEVYNTIDTMYNISQDMKTQTIGGEISDEEPWESMTKGSYSAIRLVSQTFGLIGDIITAVATKLGIPAFFVIFGLAALTISVIFGIIFIFMRFRP